MNVETEIRQPYMVYECKGERHRLIRHSKNNAARCSRCGSEFIFIGACPPKENETPAEHHVRALLMRRVLVQ